jgi:heat shock protein HtpX
MALFVGLVAALGWAISTYYGNTWLTPWIMLGAAVYALIQYYLADKLAVAMTGAQQIQKHDNPRLWRIVENLAITTGMPMPKVYIVNDPAPNAFATGRDPNHALVAATTGILDTMSDRELEAVMAHEMGHVKNYDIRVSMIAFGLASVIGIISDIALRMMWFGGGDNRPSNPIVIVVGIVVVLLAPVLALLIQSAVSRQREYLADATGVMTTRDPEGLASALEKLQHHGRPMQKQSTATAHLFFNNPLSANSIAKLFSTHPPLEERISRLRDKLSSM